MKSLKGLFTTIGIAIGVLRSPGRSKIPATTVTTAKELAVAEGGNDAFCDVPPPRFIKARRFDGDAFRSGSFKRSQRERSNRRK